MLRNDIQGALIRSLRRARLASTLTYMLQGLPLVQPLLTRLGRRQAFLVYQKARETCPAYQAFLAAHPHVPPKSPADLGQLPVTDKAGYVLRYPLEQRCYDGQIPMVGTVLDESSGSSGMPNNWVRGQHERAEVRRMLQLNFQVMFPDGPYVLLNCFALGPWATGMIVSSALGELGVLKSIGSDIAKLEHTLALLGPQYRYILMGYPPFLKQFVDITTLNLKNYHIEAIVGGEGISEPMRAYLLHFFGRVVSAYGASDLEINIGTETELTQKLRRRCLEDPALAMALFGRETPPMIFQYNPLDYLVETSDAGELVFSVCRVESAAPKLRYNLRDAGGTLSYRELERRLRARGIPLESLAGRRAQFPLLFVFGRSDQSVPFYGAKVFPTDLEQVLANDPQFVQVFRSFQISGDEDAEANRRLIIRLERADPDVQLPCPEELHRRIFEGLKHVNQDVREVARVFPPDRVCIELYNPGEGPFAGQDQRIKRAYIGS